MIHCNVLERAEWHARRSSLRETCRAAGPLSVRTLTQSSRPAQQDPGSAVSGRRTADVFGLNVPSEQMPTPRFDTIRRFIGSLRPHPASDPGRLPRMGAAYVVRWRADWEVVSRFNVNFDLCP
jgi:hypothetical protein